MPYEHEKAGENYAEGHADRQRDHRRAEIKCGIVGLRRVPSAVDHEGHHRQVRNDHHEHQPESEGSQSVGGNAQRNDFSGFVQTHLPCIASSGSQFPAIDRLTLGSDRRHHQTHFQDGLISFDDRQPASQKLPYVLLIV
jgi:hypothetical protein